MRATRPFVIRSRRQALCLRVALLVAMTALGALAGHALMPVIFRTAPHDLARNGHILAALKRSNARPRVCFFGNSVVMNGVDGHRLAEQLPDKPEVWNLSSTGQQLWESVLLQQNLPDSVELVVQGVFANTLEKPPGIPSNKYAALVMYGFRPDRQTLAWADRYTDSTTRQYMHLPAFRHRFDARWVVPGWVDNGTRALLRDDLNFERARTDLYYPRAYTRRVSDAALEHQLEEYISGHRPGPFCPDPATEALLAELAQSYRSRGIEFVLWILPRHPEYTRRALGEDYQRDLTDYLARMQTEHGIAVVNSLDQLPAERFVDGSHPDDQGAAVLSHYLAVQLKDTALCFSTHPNSSSLR